MKRIDDNTITITQEELDNLRDFINQSLEREWDQYTNNYICRDSLENGKRRMNPQMYDMAQQMWML